MPRYRYSNRQVTHSDKPQRSAAFVRESIRTNEVENLKNDVYALVSEIQAEMSDVNQILEEISTLSNDVVQRLEVVDALTADLESLVSDE